MITLYTRHPRIEKAVRELANPARVTVRDDHPGKCDAVVTFAGLNREFELYCASLMAAYVVLPEGRDYLFDKLHSGQWTTLAGSDMRTMPKTRRY